MKAGFSMFDLGYFVFMDSYENDDNKNRSTEKKPPAGENDSQQTKIIDEENICPELPAPR